MAKYRVIRDCHWEHGYREQGSIIEVPEGVVPPEHFELVDKVKVQEEVVLAPEPKTFDAINKDRQKDVPKTGMAAKSKSSVSEAI